MLTTNTELLAEYKNPAREMTGRVDIYSGSTVSSSLLPEETLVSISIDRTAPEGKFFGFVLSQKLTVEILGKNDALTKGVRLKPYIYLKSSAELAPLPYFYIDSVEVNETTNKTTVTAYDILAATSTMMFSDLNYSGTNITPAYIMTAICNYLGVKRATMWVGGNDMTLASMDDVNLSGDETLREVLEAIAEAKGGIAYMSAEADGDELLDFVMLNRSYRTDGPVDTLTPSDYFDFSVQEPVTLAQVIIATDLGDNIASTKYPSDGVAQIVWNNPFFDLRTDLDTEVEELANAVRYQYSGLPVYPYELTWRGNPFYEIGDCIEVTTLKGETVHIFLLNETLTFDGGLRSTSSWVAIAEENVEAAPISLGKRLKQTYAKVDKVNQEIELVVQAAGEVAKYDEKISQLEMTTESITASVSESNLAVQNMAQTQITSEDVSILIQESWEDGEAAKVRTATGFLFNDNGLHIYKSDSNISTTIDEDGMTITEHSRPVLTADHEGVTAEDLHATTYLIMGSNSRFEDYDGGSRTGCFWIGG